MRKGLVIAIIIGLVLAAYPLYGQQISSALWVAGSEEGEKETFSVRGYAENILPTDSGGTFSISAGGVSTEVAIKGYWTIGSGNDSTYIDGYTLITGYIHNGDYLTVNYTENPRWGNMAEEIILASGQIARRG